MTPVTFNGAGSDFVFWRGDVWFDSKTRRLDGFLPLCTVPSQPRSRFESPKRAQRDTSSFPPCSCWKLQQISMNSLLLTMTPLNLGLLPRFCFLLILSRLLHQTVAQGKLALYLDDGCSTPSELAPTATLSLSICLVPVGAVAIAIEQLPACDSGTANMIMYEDTSCARAYFDSTTNSYEGWSDYTNCFYLYITESIPGVMFTCDEPATDPQPTSNPALRLQLLLEWQPGLLASLK